MKKSGLVTSKKGTGNFRAFLDYDKSPGLLEIFADLALCVRRQVWFHEAHVHDWQD
jgi:hypothetical protein